MGKVVQFVAPARVRSKKCRVKYEVFACTNCGSTASFRLLCDGSVQCEKCECWQPLTIMEDE